MLIKRMRFLSPAIVSLVSLLASAEDPFDQLTVEQTVTIAQSFAADSPQQQFYRLFIARHANPDALPRLEETLSTAELQSGWSSTLTVMSQVGNPDTVDFLAQWIRSFDYPVNVSEAAHIEQALNTMGYLADRGVLGASEHLRRFSSPAAWEEFDFAIDGYEAPETYGSSHLAAAWALSGGAVAGEDWVEESAQDFRAHLERESVPESRIVALVARAEGVRQRWLEYEAQLNQVEPATARRIYQAFFGQLDADPAPEVDPVDPYPVVETYARARTIDEARAALHSISRSILTDAPEVWLGDVLNDGRPIPAEDQRELLSDEHAVELEEDIAYTQSYLRELRLSDWNLTNARIVLVSANESEQVETGEEFERRANEVVEVQFGIPEGLEAVQRFAEQHSRPVYQLDSEGNLLITLREFNGRWYLRPPGW